MISFHCDVISLGCSLILYTLPLSVASPPPASDGVPIRLSVRLWSAASGRHPGMKVRVSVCNESESYIIVYGDIDQTRSIQSICGRGSSIGSAMQRLKPRTKRGIDDATRIICLSEQVQFGPDIRVSARYSMTPAAA